jgi:hypothetical protein
LELRGIGSITPLACPVPRLPQEVSVPPPLGNEHLVTAITSTAGDAVGIRSPPQRERAVPITPYLRGQAFDPDIIVAMSQAYQTTCRTLGVVDRDDLKELVAKEIIGLAETGVGTPTALYMRTLERLGAF